MLRRHPEFGAELVAPLRGVARASGRRRSRSITSAGTARDTRTGSTGDEIALAGRIVAVADVFDVITSARSYKEPFASTAARDEIARCAGTQFDPRVVRAFLNISLGRLRLVMGPLSWLAHVPMLGRLPLTPAIGTVTASLATVAAAVTTGLVATPPDPGLASTVSTRPGRVGGARARGGSSTRIRASRSASRGPPAAPRSPRSVSRRSRRSDASASPRVARSSTRRRRTSAATSRSATRRAGRGEAAATASC